MNECHLLCCCGLGIQFKPSAKYLPGQQNIPVLMRIVLRAYCVGLMHYMCQCSWAMRLIQCNMQQDCHVGKAKFGEATIILACCLASRDCHESLYFCVCCASGTCVSYRTIRHSFWHWLWHRKHMCSYVHVVQHARVWFVVRTLYCVCKNRWHYIVPLVFIWSTYELARNWVSCNFLPCGMPACSFGLSCVFYCVLCCAMLCYYVLCYVLDDLCYVLCRVVIVNLCCVLFCVLVCVVFCAVVCCGIMCQEASSGEILVPHVPPTNTCVCMCV